MAENAVTRITALSTFIAFLALAAISSEAATTNYQLRQNLKETNMVFYMHDVVSGPNVTAKMVAASAPTSGKHSSMFDFGSVTMIDDKLTETVDWNSTQIDRVRGFYHVSAMDGSDFNLLLSLVFTNRDFNGSTLQIHGSIFQHKEMAIMSGTRKFRLAKGFATLHTAFGDIYTFNAILRWNVTVFHC